MKNNGIGDIFIFLEKNCWVELCLYLFFFNFVIEIMLDQITINKFIAGDVKAFERLFRKYARSMQLVALGLYLEQLWQKMLFRKVLCICGIIGKR